MAVCIYVAQFYGLLTIRLEKFVDMKFSQLGPDCKNIHKKYNYYSTAMSF